MPYRAVWFLCNYRRQAAIVSTMITKRKADSWQPCRIILVLYAKTEKRNKSLSSILVSINKYVYIYIYMCVCICVTRIYRQHICWISVPTFVFSYESVCSQSGCSRPLTTQIDLRPSAGHLGWGYSVYLRNRPISVAFYDAHGYGGSYLVLNPRVPTGKNH